MQDIVDKITGSTLSASEYTQHKNDNLNAINAGGITPSNTDNQQLSKSISQHCCDSDFYLTGGTANAITLSVQSPRLAPPALTNGFRARFKASADNTGATTVNVAGFGSKTIKKTGLSSSLSGGEIKNGYFYEIVYDSTSGFFQLIQTETVIVIQTENLPTILDNTTTPNTQIDITAGNSYDIINKSLIVGASAITKKIDANWQQGGTTGTPLGGFIPLASPNNVKTANSWYNVLQVTNGTLVDIAIIHSSGCLSTNGDLLTSTGKTALATAMGWIEANIKYRRIASIKTDSSGYITQFIQFGDTFLWKNHILDINDSALGATAKLYALTVPLGLNVFALTNFTTYAGGAVLVTSPLQNDQTVATNTMSHMSTVSTYQNNYSGQILTNNSSQIRARANQANTQLYGLTSGFIDKRGKN